LLARGVVQTFGGMTALHEIDLHVADGEVLGVIGPSGCGKSTLLSILGGLLSPTRGQAAVSGTKPPGCLAEIAYVFQDFNLLPWRTAEGNVRRKRCFATLRAICR
jgi:NitT/TauT family transport system ATP-binding protein